MLNASLCPRTYSRWVALTSFISHSFTKAVPLSTKLMAIALLIVVMGGLVWLVRRSKFRKKLFRKFRWSRRLTQGVIALTVICLLVTSPPGVALATQALSSAVPKAEGNADVIVVLGRGPKLGGDRVSVAANLWRAKRAPKLFVSGRGDSGVMALQLESLGIPKTTIDGEDCSLTTEENAQFTARVLSPEGLKKILLVTDAPHMLRSLLTFRSFGFDVVPVASPLPSDLSYRERASIAFREYGGLIVYILKGRFFERS